MEVEDADPTATLTVGRSRLGTHRGRGLQIVDDVCQRWGVDGLPAGKVVWAEFG